MTVYRQEQQYSARHFLVSDDGYGPVVVIDHNGEVAERFSLPADAEEYVHRCDVHNEVLEALGDVKLSKAGRAAVEKCIEELPA